MKIILAIAVTGLLAGCSQPRDRPDCDGQEHTVSYRTVSEAENWLRNHRRQVTVLDTRGTRSMRFEITYKCE
jgi:uncharacterized protein YceK